MASIFNKVADFARGPRGRELADKAKQYAQKPESRQRIEQMRAKLSRRGTGGPGGPRTSG